MEWRKDSMEFVFDEQDEKFLKDLAAEIHDMNPPPPDYCHFFTVFVGDDGILDYQQVYLPNFGDTDITTFKSNWEAAFRSPGGGYRGMVEGVRLILIQITPTERFTYRMPLCSEGMYDYLMEQL